MRLAGAPELILEENFDQAIDGLADSPAVYALWTGGVEPYVGRTTVLRRRLRRLLRLGGEATRRIAIWPVAEGLESLLVLYEVARTWRSDYQRWVKLSWPYWLRLVTTNRFPRTEVTARLSPRGIFYGPFRSRAAAEQFEHSFLALFQLRRCEEELEPRPDHPGCIYGEMGKCLRPCQAVVSVEEYESEARRASEFLVNAGELLAAATQARERFSAELDFESAARQHQLVQRMEAVLALREPLSAPLQRLSGAAVTASLSSTVKIWPVSGGCICSPLTISVDPHTAEAAPLDRRLREAFAQVRVPELGPLERQEHVAILVRWYYSSRRTGEWIPFCGLESPPWRKLVSAISRVAPGKARREGIQTPLR